MGPPLPSPPTSDTDSAPLADQALATELRAVAITAEHRPAGADLGSPG